MNPENRPTMKQVLKSSFISGKKPKKPKVSRNISQTSIEEYAGISDFEKTENSEVPKSLRKNQSQPILQPLKNVNYTQIHEKTK